MEELYQLNIEIEAVAESIKSLSFALDDAVNELSGCSFTPELREAAKRADLLGAQVKLVLGARLQSEVDKAVREQEEYADRHAFDG